MTQISSRYGVHVTQIARWRKEGLDSMMQGFSKSSKSPEVRQDDLVRQLYEQIGQLTVECDWLKKKSDRFGFMR